MIDTIFKPTIDWIKEDYKENRLRFFLEVLAWFGSIGCSFTMMLTVPNPPFLILYPIFITQCFIFTWAAWTRKSFGMMSNYLLLVSIDSVALARMIING
jgi:hypothetical protein